MYSQQSAFSLQHHCCNSQIRLLIYPYTGYIKIQRKYSYDMSLPTLHDELVDLIMAFVPSTAIRITKRYSHLESEMIHEYRIQKKILDDHVELLEHSWNTNNIKLFRMILTANFLTISSATFPYRSLRFNQSGKAEFVRVFCESKYLKQVHPLLYQFFDDALEIQDFDVIDITLSYGYEPKLLYIESFEVFRYLYQRVPIVGQTYSSYVNHYAANDAKILQFLLDDTKRLHEINHATVLNGACESGNLESVSVLLKYPMFDPTTGNNTPISRAFLNQHYDVVKLLLTDHRVTPPVQMLSSALARYHFDFALELLSDDRFDVNENISAIRWAIMRNRMDIVDIYRERANETNREILESLVKEYSQYSK